jgi:uncharacterized membrane protein
MEFEHRQLMEIVVVGFETVGVVVMVIGSLWAAALAAGSLFSGKRESAYQAMRYGLGRAILLGLEILIVADIIATITIDLSIESALTLGIIVLVRTFLSFSLEVELDGTLPWRRTPAEDTT